MEAPEKIKELGDVIYSLTLVEAHSLVDYLQNKLGCQQQLLLRRLWLLCSWGGDGEATLKETKVLIEEFPNKFKEGVLKGIYDFFIYFFSILPLFFSFSNNKIVKLLT